MSEDPRIAALAEALFHHGAAHPDPTDQWEWDSCGVECAAAILAALPDDWCGHTGYAAAYDMGQRDGHAACEEDTFPIIARLRRIEEAARAAEDVLNLVRSAGLLSDEEEAIHTALRAALEER
jgi:hypothetical protein